MTGQAFANVLACAADELVIAGYAPVNASGVRVDSRNSCATVYPLMLLSSWIERNPEAWPVLRERLAALIDPPQRPANMISGVGGSVKRGPDDDGGTVIKLTPNNRLMVAGADGKMYRATADTITEVIPTPSGGVKVTIPVPTPPEGVVIPAPTDLTEPPVQPASPAKGATAPSITINSPAEAAKFLKQGQFQTRPIASGDFAGETLAVRGHASVNGPDGKPLQARVRTPHGEFLCEFIDQRGPVIMVKTIPEQRIFNICGVLIDPTNRVAILAELAKLPGADGGFSFDPFEGVADPWEK